MPAITPVELGIAALVLAVIFGPKPSFKREKHTDTVDLSNLVASEHAAGRAPSPLRRGQFEVAEAPEQVSASTAAPAPLKVPDHF